MGVEEEEASKRAAARGWRCFPDPPVPRQKDLPFGFGPLAWEPGFGVLVEEGEPLLEGKYVRPGHPRSGNLHMLGLTTMGERS